jgi:hypothetical protein
MGNSQGWDGFPPEMSWLWPSGYDTQKTGREEYKTGQKTDRK